MDKLSVPGYIRRALMLSNCNKISVRKPKILFEVTGPVPVAERIRRNKKQIEIPKLFQQTKVSDLKYLVDRLDIQGMVLLGL